MHLYSDHVAIFLKRKVACVQQVECDVVEIRLLRMGTVRREEVVIIAPENQRRGLMLSEQCLPLWILRYICAVVQNHIQLHFLVSRTVQRVLGEETLQCQTAT